MQYGSIGWSVGATLGFSVGARSKEKRLITFVGDGCYQIGAQVRALLSCLLLIRLSAECCSTHVEYFAVVDSYGTCVAVCMESILCVADVWT